MDPFTSWLLSDAGAGWLVAILTGAALAVTVLSRKRPPVVVLTEKAQGPLIRMGSRISADVEITFRGQQVTNLTAVDFELHNERVRGVPIPAKRTSPAPPPAKGRGSA